jgi:endo-1,4-beta-D-glucanase Y
MPRVSTPYDSILLRTWHGVRDRNVRAYTTGMVHRPKSDRPHDAVSEGISYGMFLALYANDQAYFNSIWAAGEQYMWNAGGGFYDWRRNRTGGASFDPYFPHPNGPASDADQDIALLLIFAEQLVKNGIWRPDTVRNGTGYGRRARSILHTIRNSMILRISSGQHAGSYLLPGHWGDVVNDAGGMGTINPGYFAPAFYRVFAEYEPEHAAVWNTLISTSYDLIERSPGYSRGLLPDWCSIDGSTTGGAGYNAYRAGDAMYRDAIRIYWRLAKDYLWYREPRAKTFLDNAMAFIEDTLARRNGPAGGPFGPEAANYFEMDGRLLPAGDYEILGAGLRNIPRSRREHSHLTVSMWASAAIGTGNVALAERYSERLLQFYQPGTDYWGNAVDPTGGRMMRIGSDSVLVTEDTLTNETYFDQFLAWFGAALLGGITTNIWEDLKDGVPQGPPEWRVRPAALLSNWNIDASVQPFRLGASFNRSVRWTVTLKHEETGETRTFSGMSDTVNIVWYGLNETGGYMTQGFYDLTISAGQLEYNTQVWLGRPFAGNVPNLIQGNRLLVDDFADGDLVPYIGRAWQTYSDASHDGGRSTATMTVHNSLVGVTPDWLEWSYTLDRGNFQWDPYAALEWNCLTAAGEPLDLRGLDSIVIVVRSQTSTLGVAVHLVSTHFSPAEYQYFEDSLVLNTTRRQLGLRLVAGPQNFRQRFGASGKNFETTLSTMTGIRFQVQYPETAPQASNAIIIDRMYLVGPASVLARLYTPPPPPPDYLPPTREPIRVRHQADRQAAYSIRRSGNTVRITLPESMAGANAVVVDIRGRAVKRLSVSANGRLDIQSRNLAAGVYFVEIRKPGVNTLRLPLGNVR